jgi:hypothetical protein
LLQLACDTEGEERESFFTLFETYRELVQGNPLYKEKEFTRDGFFPDIPRHCRDGPQHYVRESLKRLRSL